MIPKIFQLS